MKFHNFYHPTKGVELSHQNLVAGIKSVGCITEISVQPIQDDDTYIGYLPLAHVFELSAESLLIFLGVGIGYSSPNSLIDTSTMIMPGKNILVLWGSLWFYRLLRATWGRGCPLHFLMLLGVPGIVALNGSQFCL